MTETLSKSYVDAGRDRVPNKLWSAGLLAAGLSAVVNTLFYLFASSGGYLNGGQGSDEPMMTVGLGSVVIASITAAVIGTAIFAVIRRIVKHPMLALGIVGGVVLLIASFVPYAMAPGGIAGISPANCGVVAILELMHGFTAIVTLSVLSSWSMHHEYRRSPDAP